jgi:hypothetical protein
MNQWLSTSAECPEQQAACPAVLDGVFRGQARQPAPEDPAFGAGVRELLEAETLRFAQYEQKQKRN